jgi:hypothetical protein
MNSLVCGCTHTHYCERHDPTALENKQRRAIAEAKDAQLRVSGALPSGVMYYLSQITRDPEGCSCHISAPCSFCTGDAEPKSF